MILIFFRNLFRDLYRQPLRTFLTLSGITWGTFSIVVLLAFGTGLEKQNLKNFYGMGKGILVVNTGISTMSYKGFTKGRQLNLTPEEIESLRETIPGIEYISPEFIRSYPIRYGRQQVLNTVRGVNVEYQYMRNTIPEKGRFIDDIDMKERRRVCLIGKTIAQDLFDSEEPVGKQIFIRGIPFTVVGVMIKKHQNSNYQGQRDRYSAFIPWTTYKDLFGSIYANTFIVHPENVNDTKQVITGLRNYLGEKYGFSPRDKDALFIWDTTVFEKQFKILFAAFNIFFGAIGAFTLLVGGVGVAAIMLIVVEERTKEIGIKLAVGAKRRIILRQFFFESLFIVFTGGVIGFLLAVLILGIFPRGEFNDAIGIPKLNPMVGIITALVLMCIGVISGLMPARRAASTNPIEALRK
jgi:putative ABC transport system permease protein